MPAAATIGDRLVVGRMDFMLDDHALLGQTEAQVDHARAVLDRIADPLGDIEGRATTLVVEDPDRQDRRVRGDEVDDSCHHRSVARPFVDQTVEIVIDSVGRVEGLGVVVHEVPPVRIDRSVERRVIGEGPRYRSRRPGRRPP